MEIVEAKKALKALGYLKGRTDSGKENEDFTDAVKSFQEAECLAPTGTFDEATARLLEVHARSG